MESMKSISRKSIGLAIFLLCWVCLAPQAQAGPFSLIGYDTSAMAGANSDVAYGESYGVLFSNPALMSRFEPITGVSFVLYKPELKVELMDRPAGVDISMIQHKTNVNDFAYIADRSVPTVTLENPRADHRITDTQVYLGVGMTYSFGLKGFRIGAVTMLPLMDQLKVRSYYADEREQYFTNTVHFARFGEWTPIVGGIVGASYSPIQYISLGIGLQISAGMVAGMNIYIPEASVQDYGLMAIDQMKMAVKFRPIIGIQSEPTEWMSIGLTWRNESYVDTDAYGKMNLWKFNDNDNLDGWSPKRVTQKYKATLDYEPMEVAASLGFKYAGWKIQGGVTWNRWSNFIGLQGDRPQEVAVNTPVNAGDMITQGSDYEWMDTISATAGTSYRYTDWGEAKLGFNYAPSPVPAQRGRTSYADSNVWGLGLGNRFNIEVMEKTFILELAFQFWQMTERTTYKDPNQVRDEFPDASKENLTGETVTAAQGLQTNSPGFPGYTQKGWMIVTSAALVYQF